MNDSHTPGSLEYLDDDDNPDFKPIDALILKYVEKELEYAQFKYKGVDYRIIDIDIDDDIWGLCFDPINHLTGILIHEFNSFLELLDTPILHDGATIREAFTNLTGFDVCIN